MALSRSYFSKLAHNLSFQDFIHWHWRFQVLYYIPTEYVVHCMESMRGIWQTTEKKRFVMYIMIWWVFKSSWSRDFGWMAVGFSIGGREMRHIVVKKRLFDWLNPICDIICRLLALREDEFRYYAGARKWPWGCRWRTVEQEEDTVISNLV